jgi:hypothetical protein
MLYGLQQSISQAEPIPWTSDPYKEKRTLPGTPIGVSWFVCVTALGPRGDRSPCPGSGNIDPIPFR